MDIAHLGVRIDSDGVVRSTRDLRDFEGQAGRTEKATEGLSRAFRVLGPLVGAVTAAFSVRALVQYADAWSDMSSRVGAAIKDMDAAPQMMRRMVDMANASYSPLEQTVEVYSRNVAVLKDLGVNAAGAADFTESLNHMLVITATRGERAASVQNALSKAMAVGKLSGDGLETVLANGGRVTEALADELGTTVSGLRGMASQGLITGDVIKNALLNSLEDVREEAAKMPATIGDAFTRIQTSTTALVGTLDQAWGISGRVAEQMMTMANGIRGSADTMLRLGNIVGSVLGPAFDLLGANIDNIASLAGVAVAALAGFYAPALISGLWATSAALVTGVAGGIKAVTVAMLANPIGLLIGGLAAGVTAAFLFRDQIKQAIGIDVVEVFRDGANTIIGAMVGAVDASKAAFEVFPDFMAGLGARAWNSFLEGFEGSAVSWTNPFTGETFDLLNINLSMFKKDVGGAGGAAVDAVSQAFQKAQGVDYVGAIASSLGEVWESAAGAGDAIAGLAGQLGEGGAAGGQGLAGAAGAANDKMKTLAEDGLAKVGQFGQQVLSTLSSGFADMFKGLITGTKSAGEALNGLLTKLGDLFANQAFNMLLGGLFGGGMGGGGGLLGGMIIPGILHSGGVAGADGYGHGRSFPASTWANAERYHRGGIAGLRANEVPAILERGETIIPRGASAGQQLVQVRVSLGWSKDSDGNIAPIVKGVAQETVGAAAPVIVRTAVDQSTKAAPAAVAQYQAQRGGSDWRI